ncbi:MAG: sterol desaturase family protein [Rhizobium sp.]|nr:sterol desaturase family protein [Rhizobium sp.]
MQQSPIGYYSDFIVYPLIILGLAVSGALTAGADGALRWMAIALVCLALWTLIEYAMHRFVFHHMPYFEALHRQHHVEERALLGTPVWLSLPAHGALVFLPTLAIWDVATATAATAGLMAGYLWYVTVHHLLHHRLARHAGYLYRLKRRHALHHHRSQDCNFGVTSGFWDRLFRTSMIVAHRPRHAHQGPHRMVDPVDQEMVLRNEKLDAHDTRMADT